MRKFNPNKMISVGTLGPVWTYVFQKGRTKALGYKPMPHGERKFLKEHHTRRARRNGKIIEEE